MTYSHRAGIIVPFTKKFYKQLILAVAAIFMATFATMSLSTRAAVTAWDQGFETDTTDWSGAIARVPSGTDGISSSAGAFHAEVDDDAGSTFSRFGGYSSVWPGTWTAEVDVYLDPAWSLGSGFDYTVAANGKDGNHQRDFIFHVAKDTSTSKLLVAGSNNTNFNVREDLESIPNVEITTAGWYTLQHVFRDNGSGVLAVDLNVLNSTNTVIFTETRSDPSDVIATEIGGNRYSWFTVVNVPNDLAIDNHQLVINNATSTEVDIYGNTAAGENQLGWMFNRDTSTDTPFEFNSEEASIGNGSIEILPIGSNPADKFIAEYFYLSQIANVKSISYDFLTANAADADQFYLNLYVNDGSVPSQFYDCRYSIVPTTTSPNLTTGFTTFTYNLGTAATSVTTSGTAAPFVCPIVPANLAPGAVLRAIAINVGDTSAADVGLTGYLDKVVIALTNGNTTVFDFEPNVSNKEQCKDGGWVRGLSDGRQFKNQGDCVSYFATKGRNKPAGQ